MSWYLFWAPQGVYVLEKYDGLSESVAFAHLRYFTDQNESKATWKWTLTIFKYKDNDYKELGRKK